MDQRKEMLQNERIWEVMNEHDEALVKKLYAVENTNGLNAIRKVLTFIGAIIVLIQFQRGIHANTGITKGIIALIILVLANVAFRTYTKLKIKHFVKGELFAARGLCFKKEMEVEKEVYYEDGKSCIREIIHYNAFFKMSDGSEYTLDLSDPYYKRLSINDTFVFVKQHSRKSSFDYYSQKEMDQLNTIKK
ncbi:hypothetical protein M2475_000859 [Breznakia sp. PF5-3]|uniref:hypothetical protein n=1 Tax=unclassified Breznakia TaxID=2623764 RepID=UPI0024055647|nr:MULTISPECIES: hypothetical protein [unclassified Breznakia]MDF9824508.1 hypothetical protein [Breznakia sp. PM6-1]MDF9835294.1 hypothetical protein [Breznakia sp. PF5-3]